MGLTSGALITLMAIVHSIIFLPSDFVSFSSSSMLVELLNRRAYAFVSLWWNVFPFLLACFFIMLTFLLLCVSLCLSLDVFGPFIFVTYKSYDWCRVYLSFGINTWPTLVRYLIRCCSQSGLKWLSYHSLVRNLTYRDYKQCKTCVTVSFCRQLETCTPVFGELLLKLFYPVG